MKFMFLLFYEFHRIVSSSGANLSIKSETKVSYMVTKILFSIIPTSVSS